MKSTLRELDSHFISKDNFIHEQNGQLEEKDKIIQSNKAEIERLEKRTKMQEHKVKDASHKPPGDCWFVDVLLPYLNVPHGSVSD